MENQITIHKLVKFKFTINFSHCSGLINTSAQ
jgi:hypothetical protein